MKQTTNMMMFEGRMFEDTQILKTYRNGKCEVTKEEWDFIKRNARMGIWADGYRYNPNKAEGYFGLSLGKENQKEHPEWAQELVDGLNRICTSWGEEADWSVGDPAREYVFAD